MKPEGKIIGISPEVLDMSASDLPPLVNPPEQPPLIPETIMKEATINIDTEKIAKNIANLFDVLKTEAAKACEKLIEFMKSSQHALVVERRINAAPNSRVKHLALHAKKRRVRKKNIARIMRENYYRHYFLEIDEIHELKIDPAIILSAPAIKFKERGSIYDSNNN